jgi:hypothetical protein
LRPIAARGVPAGPVIFRRGDEVCSRRHGRGRRGLERPRPAGFLRLRDLPLNDPRRAQYQVWIFDKNQDERYPIDGGVFDVDRSGDVVIPIRAAIRVSDPTMFAITVEKPGGVVVSRRDPIVLVGKIDAAVN